MTVTEQTGAVLTGSRGLSGLLPALAGEALGDADVRDDACCGVCGGRCLSFLKAYQS